MPNSRLQSLRNLTARVPTRTRLAVLVKVAPGRKINVLLNPLRPDVGFEPAPKQGDPKARGIIITDPNGGKGP